MTCGGVRDRTWNLTGEEVAAWRSDLEGLGADYFFSLNRYVFTASAPV